MPRIVLASTSPYRRQLLQQLDIPFETHAPGVDEDAFKNQGLEPSELAKLLAQKKAEALAELFPDALIIGGDQVAEIDGECLSKPGTPEKACQQLKRLSGQAHRLWSALAVHEPKTGRTEVSLEKHTLTFRPLSDIQIEKYVALDKPLDCAGSYRIEGRGIALFSSIEGSDYTAIIGLPLIRLVSLLESFGLTFPL